MLYQQLNKIIINPTTTTTILSNVTNNALTRRGTELLKQTITPLTKQILSSSNSNNYSYNNNNTNANNENNNNNNNNNNNSNNDNDNDNNNNKKSFKKATLLALPTAYIISNEFESDDTENNMMVNNNGNYGIRPSLRCSTQALQSLKMSGSNIFTPINMDTHDTRLCIGVSMIPHPAKRAKGGEDAYFISEDMKAIGVADGVGGWGDIGVDPALYARMLMASGKYSADSTSPFYRDPVKIMADAYEHSMDIQGSATCCIVVLDGFCLKTANLGDSGFMVIRGTDVVFRSKEQQHSFNFPYQLGTGSADMPYHATAITVNIQPGDLVIVGSDGLWDNLFDDEILEVASQATEPMIIAQLIARQAHMTASSKSIISPFAKAARENGYPLAAGGKMDDISVLVGRVVLGRDGSFMFAA